MAKNLRPGDKIRGYEIKRLLHKGNMAISFEAISPKKERVFFKQYKSPSPRIAWFDDYVRYQEELKNRIEKTRVKHFCCRIIDFFAEKWGSLCYFQVFEFVEAGHDLEATLNDFRSKPRNYPFEKRMTLSKVFASGLSALHEAKIIHADLKPPNIQLLEDPSIKTGYQLKLIDMDYSLLADRRAPWDIDHPDRRGYVGSPRYFSPEHQKGVAPQTGSDVFTAALILYELLGDKHPYPLDGQEYTDAINDYRAKPPKLDGDSGNNAVIEEILYRALDPDISGRPSVADLSDALRGGGTIRRSSEKKPAADRAGRAADPSPPTKKRSEEGTAKSPTQKSLTLTDSTGKSIVLRIPTSVGKHLVKTFGDDSRFWESEQFVLAPQADGSWTIRPNASAGNETLLNGKAITTPCSLNNGDILAVGRESKGVAKLPLTVQINEII